MIKKTVTYTNYNGDTINEDFYFNLNKAELFKLEVSADGNSLQDHLQKIIDANNGKKIIEAFEMILKTAYGVRTEDGRRFSKHPDHFESFKETEAYSELFFELVTDAEKAAEFVRGLLPADLGGKITPEELLARKGGFNKKTVDTSVKIVKDPVETDEGHFPEHTDVDNLSPEEMRAKLKSLGQ